MEDKSERRNEAVARKPRMAGTWQCWPAAATCAARGERNRERRGKGADRWARARKIKRLSLKFEMKVFPGSKIHQIFTGDI